MSTDLDPDHRLPFQLALVAAIEKLKHDLPCCPNCDWWAPGREVCSRGERERSTARPCHRVWLRSIRVRDSLLMLCKRCKADKPLTEFYKNKSKPSGYGEWCKDCGKEYKRDRYVPAVADVPVYAVSRIDHIREAKNVPCHDCGQSYHYCVMDFDHRGDEQKIFDISRGSSSREALILEIAKCDVVCANCHRLRTWNRKMRLREKNAIS